jgi:acetyl esterase/lipase
MAMMLADAGFVSVAVDYRKTEHSGYSFPGAIADLRCAVRFLRSRAEELDADPNRIGAVGFSAGGHLAALLATAADIAALDDGCPHAGSPAIQAAVAYYGVHDLTRPGDFVPRARRLIAQMLGGTNPARARLASPQAHIDSNDPPILLIHGTADRVVPIRQSESMAAALRASGVPNRVVRVPDGAHGFTLRTRTSSALPANCTTLAFLRSSLRSNPE